MSLPMNPDMVASETSNPLLIKKSSFGIYLFAFAVLPFVFSF